MREPLAAAGASPVSFTLNGQTVAAAAGDTILEAAARLGIEIPRLCYMEGMRPDGNCRTCMVEIKGERVLAPSCCRYPADGMEVITNSARALTSQKMSIELLLSDVPERISGRRSCRSAGRGSRRGRSRPKTCRIRRWPCISTPASSASAACGPAASNRSTT
jgi:formate dehydrogenase major subunit